ncbi:hypothetical protein BY996DRAFT_8397594 [Phakopsora pachyrhizi]|nr:hypothetical protein BY996DRAFT_8397594 [Phakopsora pachyrhizi]
MYATMTAYILLEILLNCCVVAYSMLFRSAQKCKPSWWHTFLCTFKKHTSEPVIDIGQKAQYLECPESVKQNCPADRILDRSLKVCRSEPLLVGDWRMLLKQDGKALICIKEWSRYWIGWTGADLFKKSQSQVRMMSYESIKGEETDKEEDNYEGIIEETDTCFDGESDLFGYEMEIRWLYLSTQGS